MCFASAIQRPPDLQLVLERFDFSPVMLATSAVTATERVGGRSGRPTLPSGVSLQSKEAAQTEQATSAGATKLVGAFTPRPAAGTGLDRYEQESRANKLRAPECRGTGGENWSCLHLVGLAQSVWDVWSSQ
jgi:hypothetical protein